MFPKGKKGKIAVAATLRAAAPYQIPRRRRAIGTRREGQLVVIEQDDFRIKRMARKAGSLIVFVVDASGSMALNRMDAAKGAALSLLSEAYKSRDKICLVEFHGEKADILVPPTKSMALTKNRLVSMPCGGGCKYPRMLLHIIYQTTFSESAYRDSFCTYPPNPYSLTFVPSSSSACVDHGNANRPQRFEGEARRG